MTTLTCIPQTAHAGPLVQFADHAAFAPARSRSDSPPGLRRLGDVLPAVLARYGLGAAMEGTAPSDPEARAAVPR